MASTVRAAVAVAAFLRAASAGAYDCVQEFQRGRLPTDPNQRIHHYTNAIETCTGADEGDMLATSYYNRAVNYGKLGRLSEAESDLEMAIQTDPFGTTKKGAMDMLERIRQRQADISGAPPPPRSAYQATPIGLGNSGLRNFSAPRRQTPSEPVPQAPPPSPPSAFPGRYNECLAVPPGEPAGVVSACTPAIDAWQDTDNKEALAWVLCVRAEAHGKLGDLDAARYDLERQRDVGASRPQTIKRCMKALDGLRAVLNRPSGGERPAAKPESGVVPLLR